MRLRIIINLKCNPFGAEDEKFLRKESEMNKERILLSIVVLWIPAGLCRAENDSIRERETLTEGFWEIDDELADKAIEVGFGITNVYQANVKGGTSTHNQKGRYTGSYDLELSADLQKLLGFETGTLFLQHTRQTALL